SLTDHAIDLFDRLMRTMFRKAEGRYVRAFQDDARAINEKVRLYARVGAALIAAREAKRDAFDAIAEVIPWDRFRATVAEAEALARSDDFDTYQMLPGLLPDITLDKGVLKIAPIEKSTPPEAEALAARLYAMLPRVRITDLMSEVARWTVFTDCFTHLRTGETVADQRVLMAGLLADGLNLGLTRMAEACTVASLGQLAWTADWHIRDETYALALRRLINQQ